MNLTEFGSAVRKARIDAKVTLQSMARDLGVTAAYLSGLEVGRRKVPANWAEAIQNYFVMKGVRDLPDFQKLAHVSNGSIPLDGLKPQQMMMLAGFARVSMTPEQMSRFSELLKDVESE